MARRSRQFFQQTLQNRSFRKQDLRAASFSYCDLRGVDFTRAQLQAAHFHAVRLGRSPLKLIVASAIALLAAGIMVRALEQLVFGALGITPEQTAWPFVVALYTALAIAGGLWSGARLLAAGWLKQLALGLAAAAAWALVGFFYGGMAADEDPMIASGSAAIAALLGGVLQLTWPGSSRIIAGSFNTIAAYALAFLTGTTASSYLTTGGWGLGFLWSLLCLLLIACSLSNGASVCRAIGKIAATCFRKANLLEAQFTEIKPGEADFSGAIGISSEDIYRVLGR
ncbi:MAG: hypothetical protein F6K04_03100 [Leptolyngbya sp. SIO4C5]|nr:hypothetical protein [Leptolyngbya sp. SIO4C5]